MESEYGEGKKEEGWRVNRKGRVRRRKEEGVGTDRGRKWWEGKKGDGEGGEWLRGRKSQGRGKERGQQEEGGSGE